MLAYSMLTELEAANQATFATQQKSTGILKLRSTHEVQECMRAAYANGTPVYPISGGKNWGNGSKVPWANDCLLLDLRPMDKIVDFNEQLAKITVQPGVTQQKLVEFLKAQKSNLMPCLTGSSRHASLIGNILERGDGFGAYGERAKYVCDFEVVLPSGQLIKTHHACGPNLEGLFFQSNLGIITQMTLLLEPKPDHYHQGIFEAHSPEQLSKIIDALQPLQLKNISAYTSIWNAEKFRSRVGDRNLTCPPFVGAASFFSFSKIQAKAQIDLTQQALSPLTTLRINPCELDWHDHENLKLAYWAKKTPMPDDPDLDLDLCGLMWITCKLPYRGSDTMKAVQIVQEIFARHEFEPNLSLVATEPRSLKLIAAIIYDRAHPAQDKKAQDCHDELLKKLIDAGYPPFRLGLQSQWAVPSNGLYTQIKNHLDPEHVLSRGHYSPLPSRFSSRSSSSL